MDAIFPVPTIFEVLVLPVPAAQPQACVVEKQSLTNRIRSQFARIKAGKHHRYQLWLLRKMECSPLRRGSVRTRKSGHFRAVGGGNHAAHHSSACFDMAA